VECEGGKKEGQGCAVAASLAMSVQACEWMGGGSTVGATALGHVVSSRCKAVIFEVMPQL
jgi:hypothetical protein